MENILDLYYNGDNNAIIDDMVNNQIDYFVMVCERGFSTQLEMYSKDDSPFQDGVKNENENRRIYPTLLATKNNNLLFKVDYWEF